MKVISVVGTKKCGKTTLVSALVTSLRRHGRVGTIKNMQGHPVDRGDTKRHFDAGADIVIGLGEAMLRVTRDGDLESALKELYDYGVDYAVVEGFKGSSLPKILMADLDLPNVVRKVCLEDLDPALIDDLTRMVMGLDDYSPEDPGVEDPGGPVSHGSRRTGTETPGYDRPEWQRPEHDRPEKQSPEG